MIQNDAFFKKLLILDKRFIGRDEHAYTILILNHVLGILRINLKNRHDGRTISPIQKDPSSQFRRMAI